MRLVDTAPGSYWISCTRFTARVEIDAGGTITSAAPILQPFVGQRFSNLLAWAGRFGGVKWERL